MKSLSILFLILATGLLAQAQDLSSLCQKVSKAEAPAADKPSAKEMVELKECDSASPYYGDQQVVDYKMARRCAFAQVEAKARIMFGGENILMQIYANGDGVKRDIDFAEHLACAQKNEVAPAEFEGRLHHLESVRGKDSKSRFDICDDITSGYMQGFCTGREKDFAKNKRDAEFSADVLPKFNEKEKSAFENLQKASNQFIEARSNNEVDLSGTGRSAFIAQEEDILRRDFLLSVQAFEKGRDNRYTPVEAKKADNELNDVYGKVLKLADTSIWGTVTKDQIKSTQKAWIKYRDAWIEFGKVRYPKVSSDSISAWFTKKRIHMLKSYLPN